MESAEATAEPASFDKKSRRDDTGQPAMKCEILCRARSASEKGLFVAMARIFLPLCQD